MRRAHAIGAAVIAVGAVLLWLALRGCGGPEPTAPEPAAAERAGSEGGGASSSRGGRPLLDLSRLTGGRAASALGPAGQVTGRVVDAHGGDPIPHVDLLFRGPRGETATQSDGRGGYEIELAPGRYRVQAVGDRIIASPQPDLQLRPGQALDHDVRVERLALLRGRVVDDRGAGVGGAEVTALPRTHAVRLAQEIGAVAASTTSEASGDFSLEVLSGDAELAARAGRLRGSARVEKLRPGEERDGVIVALEPGATLTGVVYTPDGRAAAGAEVFASARVAGSDERAQDTTGAGGRFRIDDLPAGAAVVEARAPGFGPSEPTEVALAPGGRESVALRLERPRSLSGRVADSAGRPLAGARVRLGRGGSRLPAHQTESAQDGSFSFDGLDGGPYWVGAALSGYGTATREQIRPPEDDLVLVLHLPGGLRGRVEDDRGAPVPEFVVTVVRHRAPGVASPRSGGPGSRHASPDGRFDLSPLEPGSYDLEVSAPGFAPAALDGVEIEADSIRELSVKLARER